MAQKTLLSLLALPTGPAGVFAAKDAAPAEDASALGGSLLISPAFICSLAIAAALSSELVVSPIFVCSLSIVTALGCSLSTPSALVAELRVTNVST